MIVKYETRRDNRIYIAEFIMVLKRLACAKPIALCFLISLMFVKGTIFHNEMFLF